MKFEATPLQGAFVVKQERKCDDRGWFARTYCEKEFESAGLNTQWLQFNDSFNSNPGTLRGLHFQYAPYGEIKLVKCSAGAIFDVIVDLRFGSSTYLKWFGVELSISNGVMLYIPRGFAHGFQTLMSDTVVSYAQSAIYAAGYEGGLMYNDPEIAIRWPRLVTQISERDTKHSFLNADFTGLNIE